MRNVVGQLDAMREANRQQRLYHQLMRAMQDEIDELGRQLQCVIGGSVQRGQAEAGAERGTQPASSWPNSGS